MDTRGRSGQGPRTAVALLGALLAVELAQGCATTRRPPLIIGAAARATPEAEGAVPPDATSAATPATQPTPPVTPPAGSDLRPLERVDGAISLNVWTEPKRLPPGGGQAQVIVRVLRRSGRPLPGVEVRIRATRGALFSESRVLTTDARGMVRDSLTTAQPATITVEAGGQQQRVELLIGEAVLSD